MEWEESGQGSSTAHLDGCTAETDDEGTRVKVPGSVKGMLGARKPVGRRITVQSTMLAAVQDGAQRMFRLARGDGAQRSGIDAERLTGRLCAWGVAQLAEAMSDEVWLILDGSDLRRPSADLMSTSWTEDEGGGRTADSCRTLSVLGVTPPRRGILYQHLFCQEETHYVGESAEVQQALRRVSQALQPLKERMAVTWIVDRESDDLALWRSIWSRGEHLLCRISRTRRRVEWCDGDGKWQGGMAEQAREGLRLRATARTERVVSRGRQKRPKLHQVMAEVWAAPIRLTYQSSAWHGRPGSKVQKPVWLVEIRMPGTHLEPSVLITDWPVEDTEGALRIFRMHRQPGAQEDILRFARGVLGWDEVQPLDLAGIRTVLSLAWVAAGFMYKLGVDMEWPEVRLLAQLGGWVPDNGGRPSKIDFTRGLRRLADVLAADAFLAAYAAEHGPLPSGIAEAVRHRRARR